MTKPMVYTRTLPKKGKRCMQLCQQTSRFAGTVTIITLLLLTFSLPYPLQAAIELPTQPYLPLVLALDAASAALAQCEADGNRVSVAVVDRSGELKVLLKGDGAGPHTVNSSRGKAFTSASLGRATSELATMMPTIPLSPVCAIWMNGW